MRDGLDHPGDSLDRQRPPQSVQRVERNGLPSHPVSSLAHQRLRVPKEIPIKEVHHSEPSSVASRLRPAHLIHPNAYHRSSPRPTSWALSLIHPPPPLWLVPSAPSSGLPPSFWGWFLWSRSRLNHRQVHHHQLLPASPFQSAQQPQYPTLFLAHEPFKPLLFSQ